MDELIIIPNFTRIMENLEKIQLTPNKRLYNTYFNIRVMEKFIDKRKLMVPKNITSNVFLFHD